METIHRGSVGGFLENRVSSTGSAGIPAGEFRHYVFPENRASSPAPTAVLALSPSPCPIHLSDPGSPSAIAGRAEDLIQALKSDKKL